jgi:photosystem II stability/assembly factor-like uncharacterized protein
MADESAELNNDVTPFILLLATSEGLVIAEKGDRGWEQVRTFLSDRKITSIIAEADLILVGTQKGIYRSQDSGLSWEGDNSSLSQYHIRWLDKNTETGICFAGTEPASIFYSIDKGRHWNTCPEVAEMRQLYGWSLPYSPEAGCVRGFAFNRHQVFAAVEVGGVLLSNDDGRSWQLVEGSGGLPDHKSQEGRIHPDVHSIATSFQSQLPCLVIAPTGGGLYRSSDAGKSWKQIHSRCYCRAVWIDPIDPDRLIFGPAEGVDYNGRIESSRDGGQNWHSATSGLDTPWRHYMVERFYQSNQELFAVLSNGALISTHIDNIHWSRILPDVGKIHALAALPV